MRIRQAFKIVNRDAMGEPYRREAVSRAYRRVVRYDRQRLTRYEFRITNKMTKSGGRLVLFKVGGLKSRRGRLQRRTRHSFFVVGKWQLWEGSPTESG